jgi:hypothetical protein
VSKAHFGRPLVATGTVYGNGTAKLLVAICMALRDTGDCLVFIRVVNYLIVT